VGGTRAKTGEKPLASVSEILKRAREQERKGDWEAAASEYRKLQDSDPSPPITYNLMGDLHHRKGDPEEAYRWYLQAVERYAQEGLYGNAIGVCRKILRQYAERQEVLEQLGGLFFSQGLAREAIKHYLDFAASAARIGDGEALLRTAERLREIEPKDSDVRERLAEHFLALSVPDEAVRDLRAAVEIRREAGDAKGASRITERLAKIEPKAKEDPLDLMDGNAPPLEVAPPAAGDSVDEASPIDHSWVQPIKGPSEEIEILSPGVAEPAAPEPPTGEDSPHSSPPVEEDFVPVEEILREFQDGVEEIIDSDDYQSHYDMGMSYKEMGLYEEALAEFEQASAAPSLRSSSEEMRAAVLLELGRTEDCVSLLRDLVDRGEGDATGIRFLLGLAYEKLGSREDALREYRYVEGRDSGFRDVRERIERLQQPAAGEL